MNIKSVQYHVDVVGAGDPIVLLHGFTGDGTTWSETVRHISHHHKVILIDIIGHGKSDAPTNLERYDIQCAAEDLAEILNNLNIKKADFLGYSMGGRLALTFAILFPTRVNRLILESSTPGIKSEMERSERRQKDSALARRILDEGMVAFVDYWEDIPLFSSQKRLPEEVQKNIRMQRLGNSPIGLSNSLLGMGTGSQPSWWERLNAIELPVLITAGGLDRKFCLIGKDMQDHLKNAQYKEIPHCGHAIHVEDPQKFGTIIEEFLNNT
ncbi:2-succinyl-6-hydroxy-2,4-cyclohexadiene-1-carboxylate synthase [Falsibacillus albus]|uniref:Putative 2-succinyl-6-hydroxy-2,4-cyclohexadiene-1-carboxylate synthase n=1 Tax=Falsibacillus albus TaxID=2478915 RepID=A0A3L7K895_9BACI|nr:2-succinyl-6-hydroxy-2,4-cyclohexadiene-1-carboxylate synthase [Falsibacillus albus]